LHPEFLQLGDGLSRTAADVDNVIAWLRVKQRIRSRANGRGGGESLRLLEASDQMLGLT
jgi:hypothetical protein